MERDVVPAPVNSHNPAEGIDSSRQMPTWVQKLVERAAVHSHHPAEGIDISRQMKKWIEDLHRLDRQLEADFPDLSLPTLDYTKVYNIARQIHQVMLNDYDVGRPIDWEGWGSAIYINHPEDGDGKDAKSRAWQHELQKICRISDRAADALETALAYIQSPLAQGLNLPTTESIGTMIDDLTKAAHAIHEIYIVDGRGRKYLRRWFYKRKFKFFFYAPQSVVV